MHVESNHYEKNNGNVEFFLSLVPLELVVVLLDRLSVRLEQTTTVLGPDGKGQTSDDGHSLCVLTIFPFEQRISLCCAKVRVNVEYDKKIAIRETMINAIMETRVKSVVR